MNSLRRYIYQYISVLVDHASPLPLAPSSAHPRRLPTVLPLPHLRSLLFLLADEVAAVILLIQVPIKLRLVLQLQLPQVLFGDVELHVQRHLLLQVGEAAGSRGG